jgi:hypothetical protein
MNFNPKFIKIYLNFLKNFKENKFKLIHNLKFKIISLFKLILR